MDVVRALPLDLLRRSGVRQRYSASAPLMCGNQLIRCGIKVLSVCSNCTHTTINSAVVFAAAGDIVVIAPGNYNEPQTSIGFPLTFQYTLPKDACNVGRNCSEPNLLFFFNIFNSSTSRATDGDVYVSTTSTYYNTWLIISSTLTLNGSFTINGGCTLLLLHFLFSSSPLTPLFHATTTGFEVRGALYQYGTLKMVPAIRGT